MSDTSPTVPAPQQRSPWKALLWAIIPLAILIASFAWVIIENPSQSLDNGAPPVEALTFERTVLDDTGIRFEVRAGGSEPMTIAQVQIDDAADPRVAAR